MVGKLTDMEAFFVGDSSMQVVTFPNVSLLGVSPLFRLAKPGGIRSGIAASVLARHQLSMLNRDRKRAPNLHAGDRCIAGMRAFHPPGTACPLCRRAEAFHPVASPPGVYKAEVSAALCAKAEVSPRPEGAHEGAD